MRFSDHVFDLRRRSRTFFDECPYCHGHHLKKYGKEHKHQGCVPRLIAPGSVVCHDMGHFGSCFPGCKEMAVNSKDMAAYGILNPVNRLCAQVKRRFAVHLRIHRKNARYANGYPKRRSRGKGWEIWDSTDTNRSYTKESSFPGKPQKTGSFLPLATPLFILLKNKSY